MGSERGDRNKGIDFAVQSNRKGVTTGGLKLPVPGTTRPEVEHDKKPINHHIVRKTIAGVMATATIASYGVFHKEVNNFVGDVFSGVNPFPTAEASEPTKAVDEFVIPEGLGVEDNNLRNHVKEMFYSFNNKVDKNLFDLDLTEVKNYLLTGETKDCKTFEVLNDAKDKPAFIVIKGGNNGFDEKGLGCVERSIDRLNKIDSTIVRTMADKYNMVFIAEDISNMKMFESLPTWSGTYGEGEFGGYVLINQKNLNKQESLDYSDSLYFGTLIAESRAIYTSNYPGQKAPDRLNNKVGIDKGLYLLDLSKKWFEKGKINEVEKIELNNFANSVLAYYGYKN